MSRKFNIVYLAHSIRSDWNNGNAHFLRGLLNSLVELNQTVSIYEPDSAWSMSNLRSEPGGEQSLEQFSANYPGLLVSSYSEQEITQCEPWRERLKNADFVIVHEWNPPELAQTLIAIRDRSNFRLIFHDTHHRVSSSPEQIRLFNIDRFDGVIAFGDTLRGLYHDKLGIKRVWTLHEAADTTLFKPLPGTPKKDDVVWIGNWGDDERSSEISQFLLEPAREMEDYRLSIYGVRYPEEGFAALRKAGVNYCGYLPNLAAPAAYAASRLTVHIPRQQYVSAMTGIPTIRVFEALACGIPLISAPWKDTENLFRQGDFLMVRNTGEMRRAMQYLLGDPDAAQAQALRGLETILSRHTCRHRAEQLITILSESLS